MQFRVIPSCYGAKSYAMFWNELKINSAIFLFRDMVDFVLKIRGELGFHLKIRTTRLHRIRHFDM